jgi:hypothetical protein
MDRKWTNMHKNWSKWTKMNRKWTKMDIMGDPMALVLKTHWNIRNAMVIVVQCFTTKICGILPKYIVYAYGLYLDKSSRISDFNNWIWRENATFCVYWSYSDAIGKIEQIYIDKKGVCNLHLQSRISLCLENFLFLLFRQIIKYVKNVTFSQDRRHNYHT